MSEDVKKPEVIIEALPEIGQLRAQMLKRDQEKLAAKIKEMDEVLIATQGFYTKLRGDFNTSIERVNQVIEKLEMQHKLISSFQVMFHDYDTRLETVKELCAEAKVFEIETFNVKADAKRNLRVIGPDELIKNHDIVWISYSATLDGKEVVKEDNMIMRVGSGAILMEPAVLGKKVGEEVEYEAKYPDEGPFKDKPIHFKIKIKMCKTHIEEVKENGTDGDGTGAEGVNEPSVEAGGLGLEERVGSNDQPVQSGGSSSGASGSDRSGNEGSSFDGLSGSISGEP